MAAALFVGCGGKRSEPEPAEGGTTMVGRVRVAGSTPFLQVLIEPDEPGGSAVELAGDLRAELERLSGAKVSLTGTPTSAERLLVTEYTVLDISGHRPIVGVLEVEGSDANVVDADGARRHLRNAPAELLAHDGAKVWVVLNTDGVVTGYGIIRER